MLDFVLCDDNFNALIKLEKMLESLFIESQPPVKRVVCLPL